MASVAEDDELVRLMRDLETNSSLCRAQDYPGVDLDQLNARVRELGPIVSPVFGEQPEFAIDDFGRFVPLTEFIYGNAVTASHIACSLGFWASHRQGAGGQVTTAQGTFIDAPHDVRMPDISYAPRWSPPVSVWTYRGEPFSPSFVVEVDTLSGSHSQLAALDRTMRNEYFPNGVRLGWLIDPDPDRRVMYVYRIGAQGHVVRHDSSEWRDLKGEDVLPGFELTAAELEMAVSQDSGSSSEEGLDLACQLPGCGKRSSSLRSFAAHTEWHVRSRAIAKYRARHPR